MKRATALVAASAAVALVAAAAPTPSPVGSASTSLTALDFAVSGVPVPVDGFTVLDATSYASTDHDPTRNPAKVPFAKAAVVPARFAGESTGATEARSDKQSSRQVGSFERSVGPVSVAVDGGQLHAVADATNAAAVLRGATGRLQALAGALDLAVTDAGALSAVTADDATARQGLAVSGLQLDVGDLVPLDVLKQLPLDVLLELADKLPLTLTTDLKGLLDQVVGLTATVDGAVKSVNATADQLQTKLTELGAAKDQVAALNAAINQLQAAIPSLQAGVDAAQAKLNTIEADVATLTGTSVGLTSLTSIATKYDCGTLVLSEVVSCVERARAAADSDLDAKKADLTAISSELANTLTKLRDAETAADKLTTDATALLRNLATTVDGLVDQLTKLIDALQQLLASVPEMIAAIADGDLVDIGAMQVGVFAKAASSLDASTAGFDCNVDHVKVVGADLGSPDCEAPLAAASKTVTDALGTLEGVLAALPLAADVLPDATLSMFEDASSTTAVADGYNVAKAQVTILRFELGSLTVDPAALTDGVLEGVSGDVTTTVRAALPTTDRLAGLGVDTNTLNGILTQLGSLEDLQRQLADLLDQLPDGSNLTKITTPGLKLVVDPAATAEFKAGSRSVTASDDPVPGSPDAAVPGDPDDAGRTSNPGLPAGDPGRNLPMTGGGVAILGALAVAGANGLRRRTSGSQVTHVAKR